MKVRGLRTLLFILGALAVAVGFALYKKSPEKELANDMKSQLTAEVTEETGVPSKPKTLKEVMSQNLKKQEEMVERKDFDDTVLGQERFYTEAEINEMSEEDFKALVLETENKLPKVSDIRKLPPGALHRTPAPVIQAGKDLGLLKEVLKVHESYERVVAPFYERCAKSAERPTPVRALCLTNLIQVKKKNNERINAADYPSDLIELSRMITDL
ncbi:hypothetical protein C0V70_07000 [Bacteriovorax stolpii]|uniref:Uncharacterized protein n=1 Tax=Bacteriovorax stolpii TaxID=960 RepID=A0A2K9NQS3_BACTC|nr:hypothetical protein [Bacteriovorax stolpii]AUN97858.1 hypothetical protein C0V70_07000 [Bacteriovorax stolpii]TDP51688.1 hypothetical protein C8D79_3132 [Bacteriovorax stolpii]